MIVDITKLNQNIVSEINVDDDVVLEGEQFKDSDIIGLKDLHVAGNIKLNQEREAELDLKLTGIMIIEDSISLEELEHQISIDIQEVFEKNDTNLTNTIDISDILWQNIVLEVPLRFTNVRDYSKFKGEGWKLLSEDDIQSSNNPFKDLEDLFGKE